MRLREFPLFDHVVDRRFAEVQRLGDLVNAEEFDAGGKDSCTKFREQSFEDDFNALREFFANWRSASTVYAIAS